jgi:hypothetical protein
MGGTSTTPADNSAGPSSASTSEAPGSSNQPNSNSGGIGGSDPSASNPGASGSSTPANPGSMNTNSGVMPDGTTGSLPNTSQISEFLLNNNGATIAQSLNLDINKIIEDLNRIINPNADQNKSTPSFLSLDVKTN